MASGLDADDVATASAHQKRGGGRWEVRFTLTTESSGLGVLRRYASPDGVVAILVYARCSPLPNLADGRDHRDWLRR